MTDFYTNAFSDNFRLAKSKTLHGAVTAGTYNLIRIPKWAFINGVWLWVSTACSATDVTIGWAGNTETAVTAGFMSADVADVGTTGYKTAVQDTAADTAVKYFNLGTGAITVTLGTTWTAGAITVFCQYSVVH